MTGLVVVVFASYLIADQLLKEEFAPLEACALRMDHVRRAVLAQEVTRKIHLGKNWQFGCALGREAK